MIQDELSGEIIGAGMTEPYPCYPRYPWFIRDCEQIGTSLVPKE